MEITLFGNNFYLQDLLIALAALWILYQVSIAIYNVSPLHPLSHIPGPKIAAASFIYEAWFDLGKDGRYTHEIKRLHDIYGPIIRINPEEVHCNDVAFVDDIYAGAGRKRDKHVHFANFMAGPITQSSFATIDHDLHRLRRTAVHKFFSRAQITKLEPTIRDQAEKICDKIQRLGKDGKPFDITTSFSCFTADVISGYCFGESFGLIDQPGWEPNFRKPLNAFLDQVFLFRFFPVLKIMTDITPLFAKYLSEDIALMLQESNEKLPARIRKAKKDIRDGKPEERQTVISSVLRSDLPESEKTEFRLGGESFSLITAGTETTAWTLTVFAFHMLNQPDTLANLTKELQDANGLSLSWAALEQLPYLNAVMTESLRLSYGVTARIARAARNEALVYRGQFGGNQVEYVIPKGTPVGMSNAIHHHNEDIFPESDKFIPERWLKADDRQRRRMDQAMTAFSKGSRSCLGMYLAYCNLYLLVAQLTLRVFPHMQLYETTVEDVRWDHDHFVPLPRSDSKGVRVVMTE